MKTEIIVVGLLLAALLAVGLVLPLSQEASPISSPDDFTVLTLNACWLFDGEGDADFSYAPQSVAEAEAHLQAVADYLSGVDADFIAIEEIESAEVLHRLNEKLGGEYHEIFVQGTDDYTGQDVAGLSRTPILAMGRSNETKRYPIPESSLRIYSGTEEASKHVWATTQIGDETITFVVVHLLAYPDDIERVVRREAQASIIRELAHGFYAQGHEVVILGDVNDFDTIACDAAGNEPRSCVDMLWRNLDPEQAGDELLNAAEFLPQEERYTYWYDRNRNGIDDGPEEHSMIDHIYVTQKLADLIVDVRIDHAGYEARTVSDHWPVIVDFKLP